MTRAVFKTRCCRLVLWYWLVIYNRISEIVGHDNPQHFSGHNPVQKVNAEAKATPEGEPFFLDPKWSKGWLQLGLVMNLPGSSK